ncbi:MAG: DUF3368 domain-containing protein [Methylococcales bacterium]|nr:DUF3368 domain-containing protein [Methylococcales bacterium]
MKLVLNTSPIIFLNKINSLHLLIDSVKTIFVPQGVVDELLDYTLPDSLHRCEVSEVGAAFVRGAIGQLHQGELEAIVLAQELASDYVVLDDLLARRKAKRLGVKVIGTIGILLLLEKRGALNAKQTWEKIMQLVEQHDMYLSSHMLEQLKEQLL